MNKFIVDWIDRGREPQSPPNPAYPNGIDVAGAKPGETACKVELPYPAKRIGMYRVECTICGFSLTLTTAGRPDDPRSVTVPCHMAGRRS